MTTSRSVQRELESLRKELTGLRREYSRLNGTAKAAGADSMAGLSAIRDNLAETIEAIKENVSEGAGAATEEITSQLNDLRDVVGDYSDKTEKTLSAHPLATLAGAIAVGILIGRLGR